MPGVRPVVCRSLADGRFLAVLSGRSGSRLSSAVASRFASIGRSRSLRFLTNSRFLRRSGRSRLPANSRLLGRTASDDLVDTICHEHYMNEHNKMHNTYIHQNTETMHST